MVETSSSDQRTFIYAFVAKWQLSDSLAGKLTHHPHGLERVAQAATDYFGACIKVEVA